MVKDANASLDAVDRKLLEEELPGISVALDRAAMLGHFQVALIEPRSSNQVRRCSLTSAILLDECAVFRYQLEVVDAAGETTISLVTGRVFPNSARAEAYTAERLSPLMAQVQGREDVGSFTTPVAVLEGLAMAVYAFPIDGDLPTLAAATDGKIAGRALEQLLAANGHANPTIERCRAEAVHYNRRHRCMMRYQLDLADDRSLALYGKVANDGSGARIPGVVEALSGTFANAGVALPHCLGWRKDLQLVAFTEIPGAPRVAQLLKARLRGDKVDEEVTLEDAVEMCGRIAATLHVSGLRLGAPRPLESEVARLRANLTPIHRLSPEVGRQLSEWLDVVAMRAATTPALQLGQCHGDFSYTQLIFDGPHAGLVDFDNFCQAEPALDLGQFLAYLRYASIKARSTSAAERAGLSDDLAERFTKSYVAAGGPSAALERVGLYEVINLLRMAEHAWENLKSRRLEGILTVLGERMGA